MKFCSKSIHYCNIHNFHIALQILDTISYPLHTAHSYNTHWCFSVPAAASFCGFNLTHIHMTYISSVILREMQVLLSMTSVSNISRNIPTVIKKTALLPQSRQHSCLIKSLCPSPVCVNIKIRETLKKILIKFDTE